MMTKRQIRVRLVRDINRFRVYTNAYITGEFLGAQDKRQINE